MTQRRTAIIIGETDVFPVIWRATIIVEGQSIQPPLILSLQQVQRDQLSSGTQD
jgi:hypothetical protein